MKRQSTSRSALTYLTSKLLTKALSFLLIPVWTLAFTPAEYGTIGNLAAWAGFLSPLIMIGLPSATLRLRADCIDGCQWQRFISSVALLLLSMSVLFLLGNLLLGPTLWKIVTSGEIAFWPLVPITLSSVALGALSRLALVAYQAEQQPMKVMAYEQALSTGVIVWALVFVFVFQGGVTGYMMGGVAGASSVSIFFGIHLWRRRFGFRFESKLVGDAVRYGLPLVPQALAAWTLNLSDRVMLERFNGLTQAGLYNLAANFGIVISMVAISINQAVLPRYLQRAKLTFENRSLRSRSLHQVVIQGFVALAGIFVVTATAGPLALGIMINERYVDALPLLVPILGGCFFFGVGQFLLLPLLHEKRTKSVAAVAIIGAVVNVLLNLYFLPQYGAIAAAYTTLGSYMLTCLLAYFFSRRSDWMGLSALEMVGICGGALLSLIACLAFDGSTFLDYAFRFGLNGLIASGFAWWLWKLNDRRVDRI